MSEQRTVQDEIAFIRKCLNMLAKVAVDRLEEAHKREVADSVRRGSHAATKAICDMLQRIGPLYDAESVGNAAKMREALGKLRAELWNNTVIAGKKKFTLYEIADAALAAPARNCDLYATAEEALKAQQAAFEESNFENGECKLGCPGCDDFPTKCEVRWLFAPADQGAQPRRCDTQGKEGEGDA